MLQWSVLRTMHLFTTLGAAFCLVACGGGGGGDDLKVGFAYANDTIPVFSPVTVNPVVDGLEGKSPECRVASGSLPPGVSVG